MVSRNESFCSSILCLIIILVIFSTVTWITGDSQLAVYVILGFVIVTVILGCVGAIFFRPLKLRKKEKFYICPKCQTPVDEKNPICPKCGNRI